MIELELNIKDKGIDTYMIPSSYELTVNQYREFINKEDQSIVSYLSVVLGIDYKAAWNLSIKNENKFLSRIGELKDYTKIKPRKYIEGYECNEISTIGQRVTIEENAKNLENEELMVFILAVALICEPDIDKINKLKDKMMNMPYVEILPTAFFLQRRFVIGRIYGKKCFNQLMYWIKTKVLESQLALKN